MNNNSEKETMNANPLPVAAGSINFNNNAAHVVPAAVDESYRMDLSAQEIQWARQIKTAIQADAELDTVSDYACAQLAIIEENNTERALERARHMQHLKEEYGIRDDYQDGSQRILETLHLFPEVFLSFAMNVREGNYCFVYDISKFEIHNLTKRLGGFEIFLCGGFYMCHAMSMDLEAIRRGNVLICDCGGFDWHKNINLKATRRIWTELLGQYPFQYQKIKYFNSGFFINMINSLKKRFLPREITDKIESGCKFDGRLCDFYLQPTVEAATERLHYRLSECLKQRYEHEANFSLPKD